MKRLGNIWDQITSCDNLELAFRKAAKGRRWLWIVRHIGRNKVRYIKYTQRQLRNGTYRTNAYKAKVVYEPKKRTIHSLPFFPDRIVHHALVNILGPYWDSMFIYDSYACRKNKGQHAGSVRCAEFVRNYKYALKCDVSKFYHSIPHAELKALLRKKIKCRKTLELLDEIIGSSRTCEGMSPGRGIPIGNLVSQWLGNLYLHQLDILMKQTYGVKGYLRYCDDFILFSNDKAELRKLSYIIKDYFRDHLRLSLSKCELYPVSHGVDFLGYRHFKTYILLRKSTAKRIRRRLKRIKAKIESGTLRNLRRIMGQIASALGWLKWANCHNFRIAIEIQELWEKVCEYRNRRKVQRLCHRRPEPCGRQGTDEGLVWA